jgi:hypothetical protein
VPGATIRIFAGASPQHLKLVRVLHTGARGGYRAVIRVRGKQTYFRARAITAARSATQYGCFGPSLAPSGCTAATLQPLSLASVTLSSRVTTASAARRAGRRQ